MARIHQFYEVVSLEGTHGLHISNMSNESYELTIEAINDAVSNAKSQGYDNDEKWLIVEVVKEREWNEDGIFLWEKVRKTTVALYDNGVVTKYERGDK